MNTHDDIATGTEPESSATLSERAMMLLARLADFSAASASTVELEREVLETLQQVESDAFQRAAEVCLELAHERGAAIETFAGECAARLAEVACDDDDARLEDVASDATLHG